MENNNEGKVGAANLMQMANLDGIQEGENGLVIPPEILEKGELKKLSESQIEKGKIRLQFKHPLSNIPIYHVLPFLRPFKCCLKKEEKEDEKTQQEQTDLKRQNSFYQMQQRATKNSSANIKQIVKDQYDWQVRGVLRKMDTQKMKEELDEMEGEDESDDGDLMGLYDELQADGDVDVFGLKKSKTKKIPKDGDKPDEGGKKKKRNYNPDKPFLLYGVGIQNYFVLQERLIKLFCLLTLLSIPQMLIYNYFDGYNYTTDDSLFTRLSFGDMGQSGNNCGMNFITWKADSPKTRLHFQCEGTTRIDSIISTGFGDLSNLEGEALISEFQKCYNDQDDGVNSQLEVIKQQIALQCQGLQVCTAEIDNALLGTILVQKNFNQFLYTQVACKQTEDMLVLKNVLGLVCSVIGLGICLVYKNSLTMFQNTNRINDKIFDQQLITLGDYSITGNITEGQYKSFLERQPDKENATINFEKELIEKLEQFLQEKDKNKHPNMNIEQYAVADLQLAFDNAKIMNFLEKRANHLKAANFAKANEVEVEMTKYKNENLDNLIKPKAFFVTFHTEFAYFTALQHIDFHFEGKESTLHQATEPTDIVWENRHVRSTERTWRWMLIMIFMALLTFGFFTLMVFLVKKKLVVQFLKDPPGVDCNVIVEDYGVDLMQFAYQEGKIWDTIDPYSSKVNQMTSRNGALTCFCNSQKESGFVEDDMAYPVLNSEGNTINVPICENYLKETNSIGAIGVVTSLTSALVVASGFVLRTCFIKLVACAKENKTSKSAAATMKLVLFVTFFNAGILYVLAAWSFRELGSTDGGFFNGVFTDFNSQWFLDIGNLIAETTFINIFAPTIEAVVFTGIRILKRCLDQKSLCPCDKHKSNAQNIQKFEAIYSGPMFFVHYRLAYIVNIVYIAFFFGPGIPVLIPIATAGLMWNYVSERIRMAYSYVKPPSYDSSLSQQTLTALGYAPLLYAIMSIWLFSNQQVFQNIVPITKDGYLFPLQEHQFGQLFSQLTPATPFVFFFFGGIVFYIFVNAYRCFQKRLGVDKAAILEEFVTIEGLDPFFTVLKNKDREFWFREEMVAQQRIGLRRMREKNFMQLIFAVGNKDKRRLRGVHSYDILTNPDYSDKFHYVPCTYPQRADYTISEYKDPYMQVYSSDLVRLAVDLAYMPYSEAKKIDFSEEYIFKHMLQLRVDQKKQQHQERSYMASEAMMTEQRHTEQRMHSSAANIEAQDEDDETQNRQMLSDSKFVRQVTGKGDKHNA